MFRVRILVATPTIERQYEHGGVTIAEDTTSTIYYVAESLKDHIAAGHYHNNRDVLINVYRNNVWANPVETYRICTLRLVNPNKPPESITYEMLLGIK